MCDFSLKALSDGRLLPKLDRDQLLRDVQLHVRISGHREQSLKSTRSALQQVLAFYQLYGKCLLSYSSGYMTEAQTRKHLQYFISFYFSILFHF